MYTYNLIFILIKVPNPDKNYLMYFDGEIPDYRLIGKLNPDKTPETPDFSGLTSSDCKNILHIYISGFKQTNRYNYVEEVKSFRKSAHTCLICFEEKMGSEFYRLNECRHHFCVDCMTDMCRIHAKEGTIQLLQCPGDGCREHISYEIIQQCLPEEEFERLERLTLQRTLDAMGDVVYCPQCQQPIIVDDGDTHAMCMVCMVDFCKSCKDKWHAVSGGTPSFTLIPGKCIYS